MAGIKETPRQKMIGMMYLVLTALLALNVQKEVLNAFVELDNGIKETTRSGTARLSGLYTDFKFAHNLDKEKVDPYYREAEMVRGLSDATIKYVDSIKKEIISLTEGIPMSEMDTIGLSDIEKLENYDESTRIMIGQEADGSGGEARKIKNRLLKLTEDINGSLGKFDLPLVDLPVDFSDRKIDNKTVNWEIGTFYDTPLAGSVAMLSKIVNDIRNMEYTAVSRLFSIIYGEDKPNDTVLAKVIPKSNYVLMGDSYLSDIFLGGYSTTTQPMIRIGQLNEDKTGFVGEYEELDVVDGSGKLVRETSSEGLHSYSGIVTIYDKQGNEKNYPFESSYLVARPSAVVSATKMNVLYKGVDNPLSISVPGVPDENVVVSINGGNDISKPVKTNM